MTNSYFLDLYTSNDNDDVVNEYTTDFLLDMIMEAKSKADEFYDNYDDSSIKTSLGKAKNKLGKAKDAYTKGVKKVANGAATHAVAPLNNKFNKALNKVESNMIAKAKLKKKIPANLEEKYSKRILGIKMVAKVGIAAATNALLAPIPIPASNLALNIIYTTTIALSEDPDDKIVVAKAKALADKSKELMDKLKGFASKGSKANNGESKKSSVVQVPKTFIKNIMDHIRKYDKFAEWYNNEKVDKYTKKLENIRKTEGKLMKDVKESVDNFIESITECCENGLITVEERDNLLDCLESRYTDYMESCEDDYEETDLEESTEVDVDDIRKEIYERELTGEITVEEREALLDYLDSQLVED